MTSAAFRNLPLGADSTILTVPHGEMLLQYDRASNLTRNLSLVNGVETSLPNFCEFSKMADCSERTPVQCKAMTPWNFLYNS